MNAFERETDRIYRLKVPFEELYTSVFLIESERGAILMDCATTAEDVDSCILPALKEMGYAPSDIWSIVLSHQHSDHAGGLARLLEHAPQMRVVDRVESMTESLLTYPMAGHCEDCIGVLDLCTHTLLSGDGLQGEGVGRYRCCVGDERAYLQTLERVEQDGRIEHILLSHAYEPWYCNVIHGREAVLQCIRDCRIALENRKKL